MSKTTKGALTKRLLLAGYSVDEIMAEMLKVFPGSGTTENSIYYYASKTPGVSLSGRNDNVDNDALAKLEAKLTGKPAVETTETKTEESGVDVDALREMIRAELLAEAELAAKAKKSQGRTVKVVKKNDIVG